MSEAKNEVERCYITVTGEDAREIARFIELQLQWSGGNSYSPDTSGMEDIPQSRLRAVVARNTPVITVGKRLVKRSLQEDAGEKEIKTLYH